MDPTLILFITALLVPLRYIYQWYLSRKRIWDAIEPFGGEKWYPLIGTCLDLIRASRGEFYDVYDARNRKYGPVFRSYMGSIPAVHVMKAEHVETVLTSNSNLSKGDAYRLLVPWLGDGLVTSNGGSKWRHHRKLVTPTFHFSILDTMMDVMSEKGQILGDILEEKADGKFFNIFPYLTLCFLDVICETAMGVQVDAMRNSDAEYVRAIYQILDIMFYRMFHPYLHPDFIFYSSATGREQKKCLSIVHGFARKVIQERKQKLTGTTFKGQLTEEDELLGKKKRMAFLDLLLDANKREKGGLTDEEIREEVDTFMFAGHDTSTVSVGWALLTLANHPEHQEKVQQELDEIFQGEERPVLPQDLQNMQYLDRVIKETMRVIPTIPVIARTLEKDIVIDGRAIPKGVMMTVHLDRLHKDPEQFPDPERFDPDRFLPENQAKRHPYAYVPFSAGPRNCIGQKFASRNTKAVLASILRKYNVRAEKKIGEIKCAVEIVLRPHDGQLNLALELRKK